MRPWKELLAFNEMKRLKGLQWGHGLAAVEGSNHTGVTPRIDKLQWGHGLAAVEGRGPS